MVYRTREELTILKLHKNEEAVSFNRVKEIIIAKPSNVLYCEQYEKLYGIITMGDIQRAYTDKKDYVTVNMHFMYIHADEEGKARTIFNENVHINTLPVLDSNGILVGDWMRWDDLRYSEYMFEYGTYLSYCIAFICPCNTLRKKQNVFKRYYEELVSLRMEVICVKSDEIEKYADRVDFILTIDEDEYRALCILYGLLIRREEVFIKLCSYQQFRKSLLVGEKNDAEWEYLRPYLLDIQSKGILVFNVVFEQNTAYKKMMKKIQGKWMDIGKKPYGLLQTTMYKTFFMICMKKVRWTSLLIYIKKLLLKGVREG